jgi:hypothetical protein
MAGSFGNFVFLRCLIYRYFVENKHEHNKKACLPRAGGSGGNPLVIVRFVSKVFGEDPFAQGMALKRMDQPNWPRLVRESLPAGLVSVEKINCVFVHTVQGRPSADGE